MDAASKVRLVLLLLDYLIRQNEAFFAVGTKSLDTARYICKIGPCWWRRSAPSLSSRRQSGESEDLHRIDMGPQDQSYYHLSICPCSRRPFGFPYTSCHAAQEGRGPFTSTLLEHTRPRRDDRRRPRRAAGEFLMRALVRYGRPSGRAILYRVVLSARILSYKDNFPNAGTEKTEGSKNV